MARASSHPPAFPSGVPSSLLSLPPGFQKPSLNTTALSWASVPIPGTAEAALEAQTLW